MTVQYTKTFLAAWLGGYLFNLLGVPLGWTLGPLAAIIGVQSGLHWAVRWPARFRNIGLVVLGYAMGRPFTPETGYQIMQQLPLILALTLLTIAASLLNGYFIARFTKIGLATSLLGSMPGGLSQMAIVAEEIKGTDPAAVVLMQTVRMVTVVFVVPFLVFHGLADQVGAVTRQATEYHLADFPVLGLFLAAIMAAIVLGKRLKLNSLYMLAPILVTASLVSAGVPGPALPPFVTAIAQVFVGIRMGMNVNLASLNEQKPVFVLNLLSVLVVIGFLLGVDWLATCYYPIDLVTGFISTAPGGMTEMGLTALMVHADVSTVIAFQLFRLMFVLMIAVPVVKWWLVATVGKKVGG